MEVSDKQLEKTPAGVAAKQGAKTFPLRVFCNPKMKVTSKTAVTLREACLSVAGVWGVRTLAILPAQVPL